MIKPERPKRADEFMFEAGQKLRAQLLEARWTAEDKLAELFPKEEELTPRDRVHRDTLRKIMRRNREALEPAVRALLRTLETPFLERAGFIEGPPTVAELATEQARLERRIAQLEEKVFGEERNAR